MKCPRCSGEFEKGYVVHSAMGGMKFWGSGLNKLGGLQNGRHVLTYRCKECGYLEDYVK